MEAATSTTVVGPERRSARSGAIEIKPLSCQPSLREDVRRRAATQVVVWGLEQINASRELLTEDPINFELGVEALRKAPPIDEADWLPVGGPFD